MLCLLLSNTGFAAHASKTRLFVIERNTNRNIVVYDANLTALGSIDSRRPVVAYWMLKEPRMQREELSMLEWNSAYGFDLEQLSAGRHYRMLIKSFRERSIEILCDRSITRARALINGRMAYLSRIFIETDKTSLIPRVNHIVLFGRDVRSGKSVYEKIVNG
jgi:hypothetical protein